MNTEMNEADIPININLSKLLEWLISRRIVPGNFRPQIDIIRQKIDAAIKNLSETESLKSLVSTSYIGYFCCLSILNILRETEKDSRNMFGQYTNPKVKEWQEIAHLYEKDNIYLGEATQILMQKVKYDIPSMKRKLEKLHNQNADVSKNITELDKKIHILENEYSSFCHNLGIKGENWMSEFRERLNNSLEIFNESIKNIKSIDKAVKFYTDFSKRDLPILRHVIEFGNTTVHHYTHKKLPRMKDIDELDTLFDNNESIVGATVNNEVEIETTDSIDWGEEDEQFSPHDVNYESATKEFTEERPVQNESILDSPVYRYKFIDELHELNAFFKVRYHFTTQDVAADNMMVFTLSDNMNIYDQDDLEKLLRELENLIASVCSDQNEKLFLFNHKVNFVKLFVKEVTDKFTAVENAKKKQKELEKIRSELIEKAKNFAPAIEHIIKETNLLREHIEQDISKRFNNRVVKIF